MKALHILLYIAMLFLDCTYCSRLNYSGGQESGETSGTAVAAETDAATNQGDLPYCFSWEPCQFVLTKKNPQDNSPVKKMIPSWCRCDPSQKCVATEYDRRKKMDVHKCQDEEEPVMAVRHMKTRRGSDEWIFSLHHTNPKNHQRHNE